MHKQAVGGLTSTDPIETSQYAMWYTQRSLVPNRLTQVDLGLSSQSTQQMCVIAVTNSGMHNATDAFCVNTASIDRGLLRSSFYYTVRVTECNGDILGIPNRSTTLGYKHGKYKYIRDKDYLVEPGSKVLAGDVLLAKCSALNQVQSIHQDGNTGTTEAITNESDDEMDAANPTGDGDTRAPSVILYSDTSVCVPNHHSGFSYVHAVRALPILKRLVKCCIFGKHTELATVFHTIPASPSTTFCLAILNIFVSHAGIGTNSLCDRTSRPMSATKLLSAAARVQRGSLLCRFHQKTCHILLKRECNQIFSSTRCHLPASRSTDCPEGARVGASMIGLLYELIQGKAQTMRTYDEFALNPTTAVEKLRGWQGTPFCQKNLRAWTETLKRRGFDGFGLETMYDGRTGIAMEQRVCMGIVPVSVLHHVANKKLYARGIRGPNNARTRSPIDGRGISRKYLVVRVGEMPGTFGRGLEGR